MTKTLLKELLITLISLYEQKHYAIETPDPIEAIKFRMEQMNLKRSDLIPFFGTRGRTIRKTTISN